MSKKILHGLTIVGIVGTLVYFTNGQIIGDDVPIEITECVRVLTERRNDSDLAYVRTTDSIQTYCLQQFMWKFGGVQWSNFNITEKDRAFLNSLISSLVRRGREKRQAPPTSPGTGFRTRREYRRLTDAERTTFHDTLRRMKTAGQYDTFANIHTGMSVDSAHFGPNFPGWHRVYLALFEEAMRQTTPGVSLPYWDSTLDFDMPNPVNSIIWSSAFLGNGNGLVSTGPFANWMTNALALRRNIGGSSSLFSKEIIARILTRCRNRDILTPTARSLYDLEFYHGGPHVWVGGQLAFLNSAAFDPVFFMHHAFVDYIWEQFRARQTGFCLVNPETDYPAATNDLHASERVMDGFPGYRNIDGYRNYWTQNWYRYESSPTCSRTQPSCGTAYLRCDTVRQRCVSVERPSPPAMAGAAAESSRAAMAEVQQARALEAMINAGPKFRAPAAESRTQEAQMAIATV